MKFKKYIPLVACGCLLVSCGNLPKISDEKAIEIATEMLKRRADSTLVTVPDTIVFKATKKSSIDSKHPTTTSEFVIGGEYKFESKTTYDVHFDIKNLKFKYIENTKHSNGSNKYIEYAFYDNSVGKFYRLYDLNDTKTRTEVDCTITQATEEFDKWRTEQIEGLKGNDKLNKVSTDMENKKAEHKKYEAETDQYYNYSYGSKDAKSLQEIVDTKIKHTEDTMNGYVTSHDEFTFSNDMLINFKYYENTEIANDDGNIYTKEKYEGEENITFNNVSIDIPSIADYKKV